MCAPTGARRGCLIPAAEVTGGRELPNLGARTHASLLQQQQTPCLSHHVLIPAPHLGFLAETPCLSAFHTASHDAFISSHCPRPLPPCASHSFGTFIASLSLYTCLACQCYKVTSCPLPSLTCLKPSSDSIAQQILPFP